MMNKNYFALVVIMMIGSAAFSQNLIPNSGFETYSACPTNFKQIELALPWINPSEVISDYFNKCGVTIVGVPYNGGSFQYAHGGDAYAGIYLWMGAYSGNDREFIEAPLKSALTKGETYHFSMFVNLAQMSNYTTKTIGAYFSRDSVFGIPGGPPLPFTPQFNNAGTARFDTTNWTLVGGDFIAEGGEKYILVGNFNSDTATDRLFIPNQGVGYDLIYCFVDDLSLVCKNCPTGVSSSASSSIKATPNPFSDRLHINVAVNDSYEIRVLDMNSSVIFQKAFSTSFDLNTSSFPKGCYFYEIKSKGQLLERSKIIKL